MVVLALLVPWLSTAHAQTVAVVAPLEATLAAQLTAASNAARAENGLAPLTAAPLLTVAATRHAQEMAALRYFGHVSPVPEHAHVSQRVALAGSPLVEVGENLARIGAAPYLDGLVDAHAAGSGVGFGAGAAPDVTEHVAARVADAVVRGWLDSPGHRRNLLAESFDRVGFGFAYDPSLGLVVVQVLGWEPATLLALNIEPVIETQLRTVVRVRVDQDANAVLSLDGAPATPRSLTTGVHEIELDALTRDATLAIGVRSTDGRFVLDDVVELDAGAIAATASQPASVGTGAGTTFRRGGSAPRRAVSVLAVFGRANERPGVRVHAEYDAPGGAEIVMMIEGRAVAATGGAPRATAGIKVFDAVVPLTGADGAPAMTSERASSETVAFGLDLGDGRVRLFHRFTTAAPGAGADAHDATGIRAGLTGDPSTGGDVWLAWPVMAVR